MMIAKIKNIAKKMTVNKFTNKFKRIKI